MWTTLIICLCLLINVHAGAIISSMTTNDANLLNSTQIPVASTTTSSAPFDEGVELEKIAASCLSTRNFEQLTGHIVPGLLARILGSILLEQTVQIIGLTELRSTLNLAPLPPWGPYNDTDPSEEDLASAPSIQAYYDLKEPCSLMRSLDSTYLYEHHQYASISYLDKRFPAIRTIFRRRFEEIRRSCIHVVDTKAVDRMIDEYYKVHERVRRAVLRMRDRDDECYDD